MLPEQKIRRMQADEFEKKIQNKMEGFELVPDGEVWKQVSVKIEKEKKQRRVVLYWVCTGFAFLLGTSVWWFINNGNTEKLVIIEANNNVKKGENYKIQQNINSSAQGLYKMKKAGSARSIAFLKKANLKKASRVERKTNALSRIIYAQVTDKKPALPGKEDNKVYKEEKYMKTDLPPHKYYRPDAAIADAALQNSGKNEKTNFKKDTSANTITKETIDKKTNKKWNFGFTVYSGISDNLSGLPLLNKSYAQEYFTSPNSYPGGSYNSGGNYINSFSNFKSSFSYGLGILLKKQFSKKISLSGGLDFHSYTAKSVVGSRVNEQRNFYDSLSRMATSVNSFFTVGNSVKYSNKYQLLELPVNIVLQLNKNQKKPLVILGGISPGYLLSSNALHANPSANVYYAAKEKFHHFQLSAQSGLLFPISVSHKYLLSAGPAVQYGFTNVANGVAASSQHLFFTGLKANIVFK